MLDYRHCRTKTTCTLPPLTRNLIKIVTKAHISSRSTTAITAVQILAFLLVSSLSTPLFARDYKVEAIVFKQLNGGAATESHTYQAPTQMKSRSETWLVKPSMLIAELDKLSKSPNYEVIKHYSWGQESLPLSQSASMSFYEPELQGWIKIYANDLLFVNIDLDVNGFRMREKRRIKLDEKHFFDHPKFGVLIQVSRLESVEPPAPLPNN